MATSFKKTSIKSAKSLTEKTTPDGLYWKDFETPVTVKEYGAITSIDFNPIQPHNFAVTNSLRVQIYKESNLQLGGTLGRFKDTAYSGSYRRDGKLLVAGTEDGYIKIFNPGTHSLLRTFRGHTGPIHVTRFLEDQYRIISGSNDKTARVWDIPTEKDITVFTEHQDYIRAGVASQSSQDIFLTGSYDHTVKLWDARAPSSVMTVQHGFPVESLLMFPNGGIFMSAGGNVIKLWDSLNGGKLLASLCHHHKTVTSLCFASNYARFLSASLDKHVKVYDVGSYQVVHTLNYAGPILSHAVSPDDQLLVVGMADKMLSIRRRKKAPDPDSANAQQLQTFRRTGMGRTYQSRSFTPSKTDHVVELKRREILAPYDRHLKSFSHSKALDAALKLPIRLKTPEVTISVIQELIRRGHIRSALAGRNGSDLCVLLQFIQKNLSNPTFTPTLVDVFNLLLDMYGMSELLNSGPVEAMMVKLRDAINSEVRFMTGAQEIMGSLNLLLSVSDNSRNPRSLPEHVNGHPKPSSEEAPMDSLEDAEHTSPSMPPTLLDSIGSLVKTNET